MCRTESSTQNGLAREAVYNVMNNHDAFAPIQGPWMSSFTSTPHLGTLQEG